MESVNADRWRLAWFLLGVFYLMFALLYSLIQPPSAPADEAANLQYVRFLVSEKRLPRWEPAGGGEGGYETQHAPLSYLIQGVPYALTWSVGLPENLRWLSVRLFMVGLGLSLFWVVLRLGRRLFGDADVLSTYALTATLTLMPLALQYLSHVNPDGIGFLLSAATLLTAVCLYADDDVRAAPHPLFAAARRRQKAEPSSPTLRFAVRSSAVAVVFALACQQLAFWFVDAGWNAGGRYLLVTLPQIAVLLIAGVGHLPGKNVCLMAWVALLVVMNVASAKNIIDVLVPNNYPGWRLFELPQTALPKR